jgi:hypothetical protein
MELIIDSEKYGQKVVYFDEEYLPLVRAFRWVLSKEGKVFYASARKWIPLEKRSLTIKMHLLILPCPAGMKTDHINGNGLDNRRNNLRTASNQQNLMNRGANKNNTSSFKGVTWHKRASKWMAQLMFNREHKHGGLFDDPIEAAKAYNKLALQYHGEFAKLNEIP